MNKLLAALVLSLSINAVAALPVVQLPGIPVLQCTDGCQKFDFTGACTYHTNCQKDADCMTFTQCARFDFTGACTDESATRSCAVAACPGYPVPSPQFPITCQTQCQKRDISGNCIYTTGCQIDGRCTHETRCERFNNFGDQCVSETTTHTCY